MIFKKVAVIGSNGFFGNHLVKRLLQIPGIDLFLFGKNEHGLPSAGAQYKQVDIADEESVKAYFSEIDLVYYLASGTIPASSWENPLMEIERNLVPFLKFMEVISKLEVKKVVFTSSAGTIYGAAEQKAKEDSFKNPFSPHGIIKLTMEYFFNYFKSKYNINFDVYRISNVYGPDQNTKKGLGIINTFIEKIVKEHKIQIFGNGQNVRNYIYVKDLAELLTLSLFSDPGKSEIFNLSSNDTLTINEMVKILKSVIAEPFEIIYTETRGSDNPVIYLDNTRILHAYPGFKFTSIEDGILETYRYIKSS